MARAITSDHSVALQMSQARRLCTTPWVPIAGGGLGDQLQTALRPDVVRNSASTVLSPTWSGQVRPLIKDGTSGRVHQQMRLTRDRLRPGTFPRTLPSPCSPISNPQASHPSASTSRLLSTRLRKAAVPVPDQPRGSSDSPIARAAVDHPDYYYKDGSVDLVERNLPISTGSTTTFRAHGGPSHRPPLYRPPVRSREDDETLRSAVSDHIPQGRKTGMDSHIRHYPHAVASAQYRWRSRAQVDNQQATQELESIGCDVRRLMLQLDGLSRWSGL